MSRQARGRSSGGATARARRWISRWTRLTWHWLRRWRLVKVRLFPTVMLVDALVLAIPTQGRGGMAEFWAALLLIAVTVWLWLLIELRKLK